MCHNIKVFLVLIVVSVFCSQAFAGGIGWEAEEAKAINPPMQAFDDANASGNKYVASPTANQGSVEYEIEVPKTAKYYLWVRFMSSDTGTNSWLLQVDDPASVVGNDDFAWDTVVPDLMPKKVGEEVGPLEEPGPAWEFVNEWQWVRLLERIEKQFNVLRIRVLELSFGRHTLYLWAREANTKADVFYLSDKFDEEPVFPDEAPGLTSVESKGKLATAWGSLKDI